MLTSKKGWVTLHSGCLLHQKEQRFLRLRWGFLSQYRNEQSCAIQRHCIHGARIVAFPESKKIILELGPVGFLSAHGSDEPLLDPHAPLETRSANTERRRSQIWPRTKQSQKRMITQSRQGLSTAQKHTLVFTTESSTECQKWASCLLNGNSRSIHRAYQIGKTVGSGAGGQVYEAYLLKRPSERVAIKRIHFLANGQGNCGQKLRRIQKEIQTQARSSRESPYIVAIHDVYFDCKHVYVVMDLASGGSLRTWLESHGTISDEMAVPIIQRITLALLSLHSNKIVHRDIKADNCLLELDSAGNVVDVKLSDFGFAEVCRSANPLEFCDAFVGTASYMAPEIASFELYGTPVDMYALGILCYLMLTGECPFDDDEGLTATIARIKEADKTVVKANSILTPDAKSFCLALLNTDPLRRLSAAGALQHRWLRQGRNIASKSVSTCVRRHSCHSWFRRAYTVISAILALRRWTREEQSTRRRPGPLSKAQQCRLLQELEGDSGELACDTVSVRRVLA